MTESSMENIIGYFFYNVRTWQNILLPVWMHSLKFFLQCRICRFHQNKTPCPVALLSYDFRILLQLSVSWIWWNILKITSKCIENNFTKIYWCIYPFLWNMGIKIQIAIIISAHLHCCRQTGMLNLLHFSQEIPGVSGE